MGRMKELFMELEEKQEFEQHLEQSSVFDSGILCPNCMKTNLVEHSDVDLYCEGCAQEFIKVEKSIRFR